MSENKKIELFKIDAKIIKISNQKKNKRSFTNYEIQISTEFKKWTISKRFNDFFELDKIIKLKYSNLNLVKLSSPKLFKFSNEVINERKKNFENYLNSIFSSDFFFYEEIINFINLDKNLLKLFIIKSFLFNKNIQNLEFFIRNLNFSNENNFYYEIYSFLNDKNDEEKIFITIKEFLSNLKNMKNYSVINIKEFKNFLLKNRIILSEKNVEFLLVGNKNLKGILYYISKCKKENEIISLEFLNFLFDLSNNEKNVEFEEFINFFKTFRIDLFQKLNLENFIEINSQKIFEFLYKLNIDDFFVRKIINFEDNYYEYLNYKEKINSLF
jgi:hypothetical protein